MVKTAKPDPGPEKLSRGRLFGWFFQRLDVPTWGRFFFYLFFMAIILVASAGWYGFLHLSERSDDTDSKIEGVRKELTAAVGGSEARLNSRIDGVFAQLIQELIKHIKAQASSGKLTETAKEAAVVSDLISLSRRNNLKAPPIVLRKNRRDPRRDCAESAARRCGWPATN